MAKKHHDRVASKLEVEGSEMVEHTPHAANVPGDFYVEDGCCTMCEVPFTEAPGLFGVCQDAKGYPHCYVKRQPESPGELDQMVMAIRCAELQCIRYCGSDRGLQTRLVKEGEGMICDGLPADLQREAETQLAESEKQWEARQYELGQFLPKTRPWWRFW